MVRSTKKLVVKHFEHRATGTRPYNHYLSAFEAMQDIFSNRPRFVPIPRIESGLATASQFCWTFHLVTQAFENSHHADAHLGEHQINKTRYEQSDSQFSA